MGESGGSVGPLPDGTVIEVEPLDRRQLLSDIGEKYGVAWTDQGLVDAWNASIYAIPRDPRYLPGWKSAA